MNDEDAAYEIHVHGDVAVRKDVGFGALEQALKPLWSYVQARSLMEAATSIYEGEPGIHFDPQEHVLHMCWTLRGEDDFRQQLDDVCMNLNDVSATGASIEVTFYDAQYDEEDEQAGRDVNDDFVLLFVGPTPEAIMQAQRDLLVEDVVHLMERHFDAAELGGVVGEIDKLFSDRLDALASSLQLGRPRHGADHGPGAGSGRRPRYLH